MKTPIILTAALLSALSLSGRTLTPEEALARTRSTQDRGAMVASVQADNIVHAYTQTTSTSDVPCLYIFNSGDNEGFIIVSASDKAVPMLGYSDSGSFSADNIPANMQWWLSEYANEIAYAEQNALTTAGADIPVMSRADFQSISPMCTTLWNQDAPYNTYAPEKNGQKCPIGCVATAMAQVMKYHNWPVQGTGKSSYNWNGTTLSMDYSIVKFDWDNMLDRYSQGHYNEQQGEAVAKLMYACAVSMEMSFAPDGSGAVTAYMPGALVDYFGYDRGMNFYSRDFYSLSEWNAMIYNNLKTVGPVIYSGQGSGGGHCFVCDGYSSDSYFHINWGWGGQSDGYFRLSALDPSSLGLGGGSGGYNRSQGAVLGFRPAVEGSVEVPMIGINGELSMTVENGNIKAERLWNAGSFSTSIYPGFRIDAPDGKVYYTASSRKYTMGSMVYYNFYEAPVPGELVDGTYTIRPVYCLASDADGDDSKWRNILVEGNPKFRSLVKKGSVLTIEAPEIKQLSVTEVKVESPIYAGLPFKISFKATNENIYPISESVQPLFTLFRGMVQGMGNVVSVDLEAGETKEFTYMFNFEGDAPAPGDYNLVIGYKGETTSTYSQSQSVKVQEVPENSSFNVYGLSFANASSVDPDNITVSYTVECTHGVAGGSLDLVFADNLGNVIDYTTLDPFVITEGEAVTFTQVVSFAMGETGVRYLAALFYNDEQCTNPIGFTVGEPGGIDDIDSDEEVLEVEFYDLRGVKADPDNLRPGLYIKRIRTASGISTRKVIIR